MVDDVDEVVGEVDIVNAEGERKWDKQGRRLFYILLILPISSLISSMISGL